MHRETSIFPLDKDSFCQLNLDLNVITQNTHRNILSSHPKVLINALTSKKLNKSKMAKFFEDGFEGLLNNHERWMRVEEMLVLSSDYDLFKVHKGGRWACAPSVYALFRLMCIHSNNYDLCSPSAIKITKTRYLSLARFYLISISLVSRLKFLYQPLFEDYSYENTQRLEVMLFGSLRGLMASIQSPIVLDAVRKDGLNAFQDKNIVLAAQKKINAKVGTYSSRLLEMVQLHDPGVYGISHKHLSPLYDYVIELENDFGVLETVNLGTLYFCSPKLAADVAQYYDYSAKISTSTKSNRSSSTTVIGFIGRLLYQFFDELTDEKKDLIKELGYKAFTLNDYELGFWLIDKARYVTSFAKNLEGWSGFGSSFSPDTLKSCKKAFKRMHLFIYKEPLLFEKFDKYKLAFTHEGDTSKYRYMDIGGLGAEFPCLAENIIKIHHLTVGSTAHDAVSDVTIYTRLRMLRSLFSEWSKELPKEDKYLISKIGFKALEESDHALLKKALQYIQFQFKNGSWVYNHAHTANATLKWAMNTLDLSTVDSYPICNKISEKSTPVRGYSDYYSKDEIVELAFHIELLIAKYDHPSHVHTKLIIARIIIKTNWNMAALLGIETTDIMSINVNGKSSYLIRLLKKRASYKTLWAEIDGNPGAITEDEVKAGAEVWSISEDILYLRDVMSAPLRSDMDESHPLKDSIMIFRSEWLKVKTIVRVTESNLKKSVNDLLRDSGCTVKFASSRIRKGGLNHIYRDVKKDVRRYVKAGLHDYSSFIRYYLRDVGEDHEEILANAVNVMGDYFHGREITDDVIVLTDADDYWRVIPNGRCASEGNDAQSEDYNKKHFSLLKKNGKEKSKYCADFSACLWCPHYRGIADAENVWRLLAYRDYVIADMEHSIGTNSLSGNQVEFVELLKDKVDKIIDDMDSLVTGSRDKGESLLNEHGIHPDWQLVATRNL